MANSKTAKEAWDSIIKIYKGVEKVQKVRLQTLHRQFELLQMEKSESISDYFSQTLALVNQMKANGETIGDQQIVEKILRTLTLQFEYIVTSIEESRDLSILTVDELIGSLQMHEQRLKEKSKIVEEALQSQLVLPDEKKNLSNQRKDKRWQEKHSGQRKDKSHIQCFNCKKYGHYQSDCRSKKIGGQKFHAKVSRLIDSDDEHDNALLFTCDAAMENQKNIWYLDSGCSNHMCGEELFSNLDDTFRSEVRFGNNVKVPIMGKGTIKIKAKDGSVQSISDVHYVPSLRENLLSMGQLSE